MSRLRATAGMSLVEVMVAMTLMLVIVPVFGPLLLSASRSARSLGLQSQTLDELRLVVATIGRELRSAECIYQPVANGAAGATLRFRTDAFLTAGGNDAYEVTYTAVVGELRRQVTGHGATIAATGLVDPSDTAKPPGDGVDAFEQKVTPRRSVKLTFHLQSDPKSPVRDLATTIGGRNAWRDC
jgi:Tfp pilus assembly protein PilW